MNKKKLTGIIIGLDFDGTVTTHDYPHIGKPLPHCIETLKKIRAEGGRICLNTMRSGKELDEAVQYLKDNGIDLMGVNCNPEQKSWTDSTKVYAQIYIDDAALGCPVKFDPSMSNRKFVDWEWVDRILFHSL